MDKQKLYGKNYDQTKLKHRFSLKFILATAGAMVLVVVIVAVCLSVFL